MTTKTRAQLVQEAGECLLIAGSGQSLEAEDGDQIDGKIDALLAQLAADSIVEIDDDDEIPLEYFNALAELLANACASKFGAQYSEDKKRVFEAHLRKTASGRPTYETLRTDYY